VAAVSFSADKGFSTDRTSVGLFFYKIMDLVPPLPILKFFARNVLDQDLRFLFFFPPDAALVFFSSYSPVSPQNPHFLSLVSQRFATVLNSASTRLGYFSSSLSRPIFVLPEL